LMMWIAGGDVYSLEDLGFFALAGLLAFFAAGLLAFFLGEPPD